MKTGGWRRHGFVCSLDTGRLMGVPKAIREDLHWKAGQEFVFIPKGKGMLLMPVSDLEQLAGIAKGAGTGNYRDREDRF